MNSGKYIPETFKKNNSKIIFKRSKMLFLKINEVERELYWGAGRNTHGLISVKFFLFLTVLIGLLER